MNLKEYDVLELETAFEFCQKVGLAIESAMYAKYEMQIVCYLINLINVFREKSIAASTDNFSPHWEMMKIMTFAFQFSLVKLNL